MLIQIDFKFLFKCGHFKCTLLKISLSLMFGIILGGFKIVITFYEFKIKEWLQLD